MGDALGDLAAQLREEGTPISPHVVDPAPAGELDLPPEHALVVEAVREGYLLHYGEPRLLRGHDEDLALLAGDYLYALGLDRLAALGDTESVDLLAELISICAQLHAENHPAEVQEHWDMAISKIKILSERRRGQAVQGRRE
jgi:hypothetical protein